MFAKKNVLAAAIMLFNDEILDEDEMFCVFSKLNRKNPPFPYWNYDRIEKQMDDMSSAEINPSLDLVTQNSLSWQRHYKYHSTSSAVMGLLLLEWKGCVMDAQFQKSV